MTKLPLVLRAGGVHLLLILFWTGHTWAEHLKQTACVISPEQSGRIVTVRGKLVHAAHDLLLMLPNCERVVVIYEDEPTPEVRRFQAVVNAPYKWKGRGTCIHCYKYEVEATIVGRLEVSDQAGWIRDEKDQRIIGISGFGHPVPFTRYQLVIHSVSSVETKKTRLPPR